MLFRLLLAAARRASKRRVSDLEPSSSGDVSPKLPAAATTSTTPRTDHTYCAFDPETQNGGDSITDNNSGVTA